MKKLLFALTAMALLAASCVSEIREPEQMSGTLLSLTAAMEQPAATRTMVAGNGGVFWEKGDEIKVFAGTASGWFVSDVESGIAETAVFTGSLGGAWTEGSPLWAVYPFSNEAVLEGETLTAELPAVQTARGMSFAKGMNLSVARTTTPSLTFYNVGGGLCFTLSEDGISKVVFEGRNDEILAGKVKIGWQEDRPAVQEVVEGSTSVTLAAAEGETLEVGTWYYIVALPGALEKGFKLTFYKGSLMAQVLFDKAVTVKRSIYGEVPNADAGASYVPVTDENIRFKDAKVKDIVVRYFDTGKDGELSYQEAAAVKSFFVDELITRADGGPVSIFAGTDIETFDEIEYFTGLTKIEDGAFAGCTSLTSITIPEFITEIGANAFAGCTGLETITIESETPPAIGEGAFSDTNDCPIIVPAGTTETYTTAWGEYAPRIEGGQPDNEIWYTTSSGDVFAPNSSNDFGAQIVSNTYENGKGVIAFDGPVSRIGKESFAGYAAPQGNNGLTSIKLPNSVKSLGYLCFGYCAELEEVSLPAGITEMEEYVFFYCKSLKSIEVPAGIKRIELGTFRECTSLSSVILPDGLVTIGVQAFQSCTSLTSLEIPETVTEIGAKAFSTCQVLTGITIPRGVTLIDNNAFQGCRALTEISIDGATVIDTSAFSSCRGLTSVLLSEKVVSVGERAFSGCSGLTEITSLALVPPPGGESMFNNTNNCPIYVPAGSVEAYKAAEYWSEYADRIQALEPEPQPDNEIWYTSTDGNIVLPNDTGVFGANFLSNEYNDGKGVLKFDGPVTMVGELAFLNCETLREAILPKTVTTIGGGAFYNNTGLESVHIPELVSDIGIQAFMRATNITKITVDPGNVTYDSRENCNAIIHTATNTLISGCQNSFIPNDVKLIGDYAFVECRGLIEITIPESVDSIGISAFNYCEGLTSLSIPSSVTSLGAYAFNGCKSLSSIILYHETPPEIGRSCFRNGSTCPIYVPTGSVESYKAAESWSDYVKRILPMDPEARLNREISYTSTDGGKVTPSYAQYNIPAETAFGGALVVYNSYTDGKGKIIFDSDVTELVNSFQGCTNLHTITLPPSVAYIGGYSFAGCENLTGTIKIPEGQTTINNAVFQGCTSLTGVDIPEGVTYVGSRVFSGCTSLTELTFPKSLTSISYNAAYGCSGLKRITVLAETPPRGGTNLFTGSECPIYVPAASVEAYKAAQYWSEYADRIQAIP